MNPTRQILVFAIGLAALLVLAACSSITPPAASSSQGSAAQEATPAQEATEAPTPTEPRPTAVVGDEPPPFSTRSWSTDFTKHSVDWNEILSGGPPKDGIPAVDDPTFESVAAAAEWLTDQDPVILFQADGISRAYPLSILIWHEIVNDQVGSQPVSITFCPLCNASIAFDRRLDGMVLDFGTTGKLRNSDLVMYDRQTESWWQQFTGEAIVGELTGKRLTFLPSQVISFGDFADRFPDGEVLARPKRGDRFLRSYGRNPYVGYDSSTRPFLFLAEPDPRLPATERVVGITTETAAKAYPFSVVREAGLIQDEFEGTPLVIFYKAGTASALDAATISEGKDVGTAAVYNRDLEGDVLTFKANGDGTFRDVETGTTWNILGEGIDGPLTGSQLVRIQNFDHFWFAWAAFFPDTQLYEK